MTLRLSKNAMLTKGMTKSALKDLPVGGSAWTVPWAMYADKDGKMWLNGNYTPSTKGGTVTMLVYRKEQGFVVDISEAQDNSWEPTGAHYVGGALPMRVIEVVSATPDPEPNVVEATHYGRTYRFIVKDGKLAVMHGKKYIAHDIPFDLPVEVLDGPMGTALVASVEAGHKVGINVGFQKAVKAVEDAMVSG